MFPIRYQNRLRVHERDKLKTLEKKTKRPNTALLPKYTSTKKQPDESHSFPSPAKVNHLHIQPNIHAIPTLRGLTIEKQKGLTPHYHSTRKNKDVPVL